MDGQAYPRCKISVLVCRDKTGSCLEASTVMVADCSEVMLAYLVQSSCSFELISRVSFTDHLVSCFPSVLPIFNDLKAMKYMNKRYL